MKCGLVRSSCYESLVRGYPEREDGCLINSTSEFGDWSCIAGGEYSYECTLDLIRYHKLIRAFRRYRITRSYEDFAIATEIDCSQWRLVCWYDGNIARRNLNDADLSRCLTRERSDF